MTNIDDFADWTATTWISGDNPNSLAIMSLGLAGETGEALEHIKKRLRDNKWDEDAFIKEMGDVVHYWAKILNHFGISPSYVLAMNQEKIKSRQQRNVLAGSGDNR